MGVYCYIKRYSDTNLAILEGVAIEISRVVMN